MQVLVAQTGPVTGRLVQTTGPSQEVEQVPGGSQHRPKLQLCLYSGGHL